MLYYLLSILLAVVVSLCYLMKTKKWNSSILLIFFILIMTVIVYYALNHLPYTLKGEESRSGELFLFLFMIIGMLARQIFYSIRDGKAHINITVLFKPILVAPIVFLITWGIAEKMKIDAVITYCFAFQNGFFWEIIFKKAKKNY